MERNKEFQIERDKFLVYRMLIIVADLILVTLATYLSLKIRFDFESIPIKYIVIFQQTLILNLLIYFAIFSIFKLYNILWSFFSMEEVLRLSGAVAVAVIIETLLFIFTPLRMPGSYYFIKILLLIIMMLALRFIIRIIKEKKISKEINDKTGTNVMLIGAGSAASLIIKELNNYKKIKYNIKCILDDNYLKIKNRLRGIEIVGDTTQIDKCVDKYHIDEIIIAIPSASKERISEIVQMANKTSAKVKIFEGIYDNLKKNFMSTVRDASYEDLLERDPVKVDDDEIKNSIKGKVVMVTGGGGSIGSELCRHIMEDDPKLLIILDIYENNAYDIQLELENEYDKEKILAIIASVRDYDRMEEIFKKYKPEIVFHAAAHKHVPLMEVSPNEAIKNNCFGTLNTAKLADKYMVENFVLVSSDKAVRPTNIMGATKRICEMIVQAYAKKSKTKFVAVRFGNVLGSNGSVIPLFTKQIEQGGPVTVTHKDITRFFMTIPEAVELILQANTYAKGGEIFVLDMGKPVKIYDLAEHIIRLHGYEPHKDIEIEIVGLRPGEKLYEELLMDEEGLQKTDNELIYIAQPIKMNDEKFFVDLDLLIKESYKNGDKIREVTKKICTTYNPENGGNYVGNKKTTKKKQIKKQTKRQIKVK